MLFACLLNIFIPCFLKGGQEQFFHPLYLRYILRQAKNLVYALGEHDPGKKTRVRRDSNRTNYKRLFSRSEGRPYFELVDSNEIWSLENLESLVDFRVKGRR